MFPTSPVFQLDRKSEVGFQVNVGGGFGGISISSQMLCWLMAENKRRGLGFIPKFI